MFFFLTLFFRIFVHHPELQIRNFENGNWNQIGMEKLKWVLINTFLIFRIFVHCSELQNREFYELVIGIGWKWFFKIFANHPVLWNWEFCKLVDGIRLFSIFTNSSILESEIRNQELNQ